MSVLTDNGTDFGNQSTMRDRRIDLSRAREISAAIERAIARGVSRFLPLLAAVQAEIAVATAEDEIEPPPAHDFDPLFRLHMRRWAADDGDLLALVPIRDPRVRLIEFDMDVSIYLAVRTAEELLKNPVPGHSYLVAFAQSHGERRGPLLVEEAAAEFLEFCDGTRTVYEILKHTDRHGTDMSIERKWVDEMFLSGLFSLHEERIHPGVAPGSHPLKRIDVRSTRQSIEIRP
jgi:hypothetical protein